MVDISKVQGLEQAKREVMDAWRNAGKELNDLNDKISDATRRFLDCDSKYTRDEIGEELKTLHGAWNVSYGMTQMCSQLCNRLEDLIDAEYEADKEAV